MQPIDWQKTKKDLEKWWDIAYRIAYIVGIRSVRCLKATVRFTRMLWAPLWRGFCRVADVVLLRFLREGFKELCRLWQEIRLAKQAGKLSILRQRLFQLVRLPCVAVKRYKKLFRTLFNIAAPALALVLLVTDVHFWKTSDYALALEYEGNSIGYIANENTYTNADALIRETVINADESFKIEQSPQLTVSLLGETSVLKEQEVSNRILESMGDRVQHGAGLYVDGTFHGTLPLADNVNSLLNDRLGSYPTEEGVTTDFLPKVSVVSGLYPESAFVSQETMRAYVSTLTVKTIRNITYVEKAPYKTIIQETETLPLGYRVVKVKGKNGSQRVHAQVISVDGKEQYRVVVGTEYIKAPVHQVEQVGAQKYNGNTELGDGKATGTFIWPLPYTKQISSHFASRWGSFHGAIDISNGSTDKKPIIASDGGVVEEAGWHSSYGFFVLINHGNGFKTRYAHCSKLYVKTGDRVAQGQYIAKVGSTGYSTGPHLHFEVIKNGVLVDPLLYVKR